MDPASSESNEIFTDRIKALITAFDQALGCPPFDCPSDTAISVAEKLAAELEKRDPQSILALAELPEVYYTFPVLCAAVPEGSASAVPVPLYRHLIRSLSQLVSIVKYPLNDIVKKSLDILSLHDVVLINFLHSTKSLQKEHMEKLLHLSPLALEKQKNQRKKQKLGKHATPVNRCSPLDSSNALLEIPEELLLWIFSTSLEEPLQAVVSRFISSSLAFDTITKSSYRLAELIFESGYGHQLLPVLSYSSLLPVLSGKLWPFFIELVDRHQNREIIRSLTSYEVVKVALRSWMEKGTNRWDGVVDTATKSTLSSNKCRWGTLASSIFLYHCSLFISKECSEDLVLIPYEERLLLLVLEINSSVEQFVFGESCHHASAVKESIWLYATETLLNRLYRSERKWFDAATGSKNIRQQGVRLRDCLLRIWKKKKPWKASSQSHHSSFTLPLSGGKKLASKDKGRPATNKHQRQPMKKRGKGKDEGGGRESNNACEKQEVVSSEEFTEEMLQKWIIIFFYLDEILDVACEEKWETIIVIEESLSEKFKWSPCDNTLVSKNTWKLFLKHVEGLGRRIFVLSVMPPSLSLPQLFPYLSKAIKGSALVCWIAPFVLTSSQGTHKWLQQWPVTLMVELVLGFCKTTEGPSFSGLSEMDPLTLAGRWFCILLEPQKQALLTALGNLKDSFDPLLSFLCANPAQHLKEENGNMEEKNMDDSSAPPLFFHNSLKDWQAKNAVSYVVLEEHGKEGVQEFLGRVQKHIEEKAMQQEAHQQMILNALAERLRQKVLEDTQLFHDHERYKVQESQKNAIKQQEQEKIRGIVKKKQEETQRKKELMQQQLQQQRSRALVIAAEREKRSAEERAAMRRERLEEYKESSLRAFRASTFLHALGLSTSRVIDILDNIVSKNKDIRPDDLLEYVVTGHPCIPEDMLNESDSDGDNNTAANAKDQGTNREKPHYVECSMGSENVDKLKQPISFWEAVLEGVPELKEKETKKEKEGAMAESHSFHFRTKLYLDLFCYDGGDEYGQLPETLPQVSVRLAAKLLSSSEVIATGFRSAEEAFDQLSRRKLIRLKNTTGGKQSTIAQLTTLGFRYHFPFHNSEGMLAVRLLAQKEKALALLSTRRPSPKQEPAHLFEKAAYQDLRRVEEEEEDAISEESELEEEWTDFENSDEKEVEKEETEEGQVT